MKTIELSLDRCEDSVPTSSVCGDWRLYEYRVTGSTNLIAANLPEWSAVRADVQTKGRGRFQRSWVSDAGGLWLSAVVPASEDKIAQRTMPLATGLAICNVLQELGISRLRMRWPNDVLIGKRKLAGLLIDRFVPGLAVVGIGLNVRNRPETCDPKLTHQTARLEELMSSPPELGLLTKLILQRLRIVLTELSLDGTRSVLLRANTLWGSPRPVELDLDGKSRRGVFTGVDLEGRLILSNEAGERSFYDAHEVRHLTEI